MATQSRTSIACLLATISGSGASLAVPTAINVPFNATDGSYAVVVGGQTLFRSGATYFRAGNATYSTADGTLTLASSADASGADGGGAFDGTNMTWRLGAAATAATVHTAVRVYASHAVFEQRFPEALAGTAAAGEGRDAVLSAFPSFAAPTEPRGVLAFKSDMCASGASASTWGGAAAAASTDVRECRVSPTGAAFKPTGSGAGYDAYTPADGGHPRQYQKHGSEYCGEGTTKHAPTSYEGKQTLAACQQKCEDVLCSCFDWQSGAAPAPPSGGIGGGIKNSGPVAFFDAALAGPTAVISGFSSHMAHSQFVEADHSLSYGIMGGVAVVPAGFSISTVVALGAGVNGAMDAWGDTLLAASGKERYAYRRDPANQQLGYSTDNGAYYYYQTEPGKTYEETLLDVAAYAKRAAIPYRYVLLDSWWYFRGAGNGVKLWDARPDVFPNGLENLWQKTGWPTMLHNRMWAPDTNYSRKNGGACTCAFLRNTCSSHLHSHLLSPPSQTTSSTTAPRWCCPTTRRSGTT